MVIPLRRNATVQRSTRGIQARGASVTIHGLCDTRCISMRRSARGSGPRTVVGEVVWGVGLMVTGTMMVRKVRCSRDLIHTYRLLLIDGVVRSLTLHTRTLERRWCEWVLGLNREALSLSPVSRIWMWRCSDRGGNIERCARWLRDILDKRSLWRPDASLPRRASLVPRALR